MPATIAAAVRSASAGAGSALLVEGEAGIGKTSLLAQATPMCPTCAG
jgi:predicted ATPase